MAGKNSGSRREKKPASSRKSRQSAKSEKQATPRRQGQKAAVSKTAELNRVTALLPVLSSKLLKGDIGRMVVIGGSKEMALAPGFAAYAQVKSGADNSTVFLHPDANADLIRQKFMAVLVRSTHDFDTMLATLEKCDGIVIGPGLVRDESRELPLLKNLLNFSKTHTGIPLIIDANAIDLLAKCQLADLPGTQNIATTPNHKEFELLCRSFEIAAGSEEARSKQLAKKLGMCVVVKGAVDHITDGSKMVKGNMEGSLRRTAGLGDIYAGLSALFTHYARLRSTRQVITKEDLLTGCHAASDLMRYACRVAYYREGRTMTVEEVLKYLAAAVKEAEKGMEGSPQAGKGKHGR